MLASKIPKNCLCVTGSFASRKNGRMAGFEPLLEKECMPLLDFDDNVESFEEQPVTIPVPGVAEGQLWIRAVFPSNGKKARGQPCWLARNAFDADLPTCTATRQIQMQAANVGCRSA